MKELAGLGSERLGRRLDDEVLVLVVDPFVGDDGTKALLGGALRRRVAVTGFSSGHGGGGEGVIGHDFRNS